MNGWVGVCGVCVCVGGVGGGGGDEGGCGCGCMCEFVCMWGMACELFVSIINQNIWRVLVCIYANYLLCGARVIVMLFRVFTILHVFIWNVTPLNYTNKSCKETDNGNCLWINYFLIAVTSFYNKTHWAIIRNCSCTKDTSTNVISPKSIILF